MSKQGNSPAENEDRFSLRRKKNILLAASDGATEASYSGEWAELLVRSGWKHLLLSKSHYRAITVPQEMVRNWLEPIRQEFNASQSTKSLPWYSVEKARQGAFATFLGFRMSPRGQWMAVSCGDTCLIRLARGLIIDSFPIFDPVDFENQPNLVSSKPGSPIPEMAIHSGELVGGDEIIVLATDALAAWILSEDIQLERVNKLIQCESEEEFCGLISMERQKGNIKNDDTTVVIHRGSPPRI